MDYKGIASLPLNDEQLAQYYQGDLLPEEFVNVAENQYLFIVHNGEALPSEIWKKKHGKLQKVKYQTIYNKFTNDTIKPLDPYQAAAIDMLFDEDLTVKVVRGVYGSGKDYLLFNYALQQVEDKKYDKIIYLRPNVTVAGVPEIGFKKGSEDDKLGWTLKPLYDKVGGREGIELLREQEKLEMDWLGEIRGCTFENCIVYVTEGQNMTTEIVKLILGRIGKNAELIINGDSHQTDNRLYEKDNGITKLVDKLTGNELFSYMYLPITHRSKTAALADLLDED